MPKNRILVLNLTMETNRMLEKPWNKHNNNNIACIFTRFFLTEKKYQKYKTIYFINF